LVICEPRFGLFQFKTGSTGTKALVTPQWHYPISAHDAPCGNARKKIFLGSSGGYLRCNRWQRQLTISNKLIRQHVKSAYAWHGCDQRGQSLIRSVYPLLGNISGRSKTLTITFCRTCLISSRIIKQHLQTDVERRAVVVLPVSGEMQLRAYFKE